MKGIHSRSVAALAATMCGVTYSQSSVSMESNNLSQHRQLKLTQFLKNTYNGTISHVSNVLQLEKMSVAMVNKSVLFCEGKGFKSAPVNCDVDEIFLKSTGIYSAEEIGLFLSNFDVKMDPVYGRRLYAKKALKSGDILLEERPIFFGTPEMVHVTDSVFLPAFVKGCLSGQVPAGTCVVADVIGNIVQYKKKLQKPDFDRFISFFYRESWHMNEDVDKTNAHMVHAEYLWGQLNESTKALVAVKDIAEWLDIINSNAHNFGENGLGLFFLIHLLEHSCAPNCHFFTPVDSIVKEKERCAAEANEKSKSTKPKDNLVDKAALGLRCVSTSDIEKGSPVAVSYVSFSNLLLPTFMRGRYLKRKHAFDCQCDRCSKLPERSRSFACPACNGSRLMPPTPSTSKALTHLVCMDCKRAANSLYVADCLRAEETAFTFLMKRDALQQAMKEGRMDQYTDEAMRKIAQSAELTQSEDRLLSSHHFLRVRMLLKDVQDAVSKEQTYKIYEQQKSKEAADATPMERKQGFLERMVLGKQLTRKEERDLEVAKFHEGLLVWGAVLLDNFKTHFGQESPYHQVIHDLLTLGLTEHPKHEEYVKKAQHNRKMWHMD